LLGERRTFGLAGLLEIPKAWGRKRLLLKTRTILLALLLAAMEPAAGGCFSAASMLPGYGGLYDYANYGYGPFDSFLWDGYLDWF
jgi:amino acid transporter